MEFSPFSLNVIHQLAHETIYAIQLLVQDDWSSKRDSISSLSRLWDTHTSKGTLMHDNDTDKQKLWINSVPKEVSDKLTIERRSGKR